MAPQRPLLLLSLDGGGIRGLSSIMILKEIMKKVNVGRSNDQKLQPWQVFDLIGGTSTGGIIAVMLGRLHMSLQECEEAYIALGKEIFEPKRAHWDGRRVIDLLKANEKFDSSVLERSIKAIIKEKTGDENSLLKPTESTVEGDCKVFVCSVLESNAGAVYLRSYESGHLADPISDDLKLWQALRATSAASTFFKAYQHRSMKFIDGGFAYNNPVQRVKVEASDLWGADHPSLLISIGTGEDKHYSLGGNIKNLAQNMIKLVTQTEQTAEDFLSLNRDMANAGMYFRFNARLDGIGMEEYNELGKIREQTTKYLTRAKTGQDLSTLVRKVRDIQNIQAADDLDSTRLGIADFDERTQHCLQALFAVAGDYTCHRSQLDQPISTTCSWILEHPKFLSFRESENPALLWLTGNPGCGKSILARFVADKLESDSKAEGAKVSSAPIICSFFFKDGQDNRTQSHSAVSALIHQLFTSCPILSKFGQAEYAVKGNAFAQSADAVWKVICRACSSIPGREVICIIDALDECSEESRNRFIRMIMSTLSAPDTKKTIGCLKVLVTSRPLPEIETKFEYGNVNGQRQFESDSINRLRIEDETSAVAHDVAAVIEHGLHNLRSNRVLTQETCDVVEKVLKEKADGTFLWVSLVLESIVTLRSRKLQAVKRTLNSIPKDLDDLYARALPELHEADRDLSQKLLSILLVATRPLSLDEINICLSLDLNTENIFDMEQEPDINYTVKTLGGLFIRIARSQVTFVHQTAREYLLRNSSTISGKPRQHSIDSISANVTLAKCCLRYLLLQNWVTYLDLDSADEPKTHVKRLIDILPETLGSFYQYAATNWSVHVRAGGPSYVPEPELHKEIHALCDKSSKSFAIWWTCYSAFNLYNIYSDGYYMHYVAAKGDWFVLRELLEENSSDADTKDEGDRTPLLEAATKGHAIVAELLLANGADVNVIDEDGHSPLLDAAMNGHEGVAGLLLGNGADVNAMDDDGWTPLLHAAANGYTDVTKLLLNNSAATDATDKDGRTALLGAAENGHESVAILLVDNGGEINAADEYGATPLILAAENGHKAIAKLLLERGASIEAASKDGWTPLLQATKNGHEDVVELLLRRGATVNGANKSGWTPLLEAAKKGHEVVARLLLENGADIEAKDGYGWTPLWWATNDSRVAVAKLLVENGAEVDAKAETSCPTPLLWAIEYGQRDIVTLLLKHGATVNRESSM